MSKYSVMMAKLRKSIHVETLHFFPSLPIGFFSVSKDYIFYRRKQMCLKLHCGLNEVADCLNLQVPFYCCRIQVG